MTQVSHRRAAGCSSRGSRRPVQGAPRALRTPLPELLTSRERLLQGSLDAQREVDPSASRGSPPPTHSPANSTQCGGEGTGCCTPNSGSLKPPAKMASAMPARIPHSAGRGSTTPATSHPKKPPTTASSKACEGTLLNCWSTSLNSQLCNCQSASRCISHESGSRTVGRVASGLSSDESEADGKDALTEASGNAAECHPRPVAMCLLPTCANSHRIGELTLECQSTTAYAPRPVPSGGRSFPQWPSPAPGRRPHADLPTELHAERARSIAAATGSSVSRAIVPVRGILSCADEG